MADTSVMPSFSALNSPLSLKSSSSTPAIYFSPSSQPSINNSVSTSISLASSSVKSLPQIREQSSYGMYGTTSQQADQQLRSPRAPKTLRIECGARVIQWNLEDEHLNFSRLQNYIQSAFFIEDERQFSIRYKPAVYGNKTEYRYIHDDASLHEALGNVDIFVEVQMHKLDEDDSKPGLSFTEFRRPNRLESVLPEYASAAGNSSRYLHLHPPRQAHGPHSTIATSPLSPSTHSATVPKFHPILPTSSPSLPSLSSSADVLQRRKSSIFIPPPLKRASSTRISGVTQTIRQKLQFTDEGQWKKFSARRLELIDSMSLSTKKASEQDDVIIAVADTLREEYGFPPQTLPDFDKLVRAAVQSVRRNRKRLPKSKARSKSLSVERDDPKDEQQQQPQPQPQPMQLRGQWPLSPELLTGVENISVSSDLSSDAAKADGAPCGMNYVNYRPPLRSRRSEPSIVSARTLSSSHPSLVRSPTASSSSSTSTFSSCLSADDEQNFYSTGTGTVANSRDNLPRTLPSSATFMSGPQSSMTLELIYCGRVIPCAIRLTDLAGNTQSSLSFLLNTVRKTLALPDDAPVALYYFRVSDGVRVQITSEADADLAMRASPPDVAITAMQALRVEVITMTQVQALHQQQQQSTTDGSPSLQLAGSTSSADAAQRISIGALVGV
ncbi:transcription factor Vhr1-domain-containing protein [Lipomyces doorenjongii]|uniref:transcription factor Vhr1-domain-containing protein n=1 Tax=Lipomyces doorenjongii TaxID=383834 RepID=UPI0034CF71CB